MRFRDGLKGVTPILSIPSTRRYPQARRWASQQQPACSKIRTGKKGFCPHQSQKTDREDLGLPEPTTINLGTTTISALASSMRSSGRQIWKSPKGGLSPIQTPPHEKSLHPKIRNSNPLLSSRASSSILKPKGMVEGAADQGFENLYLTVSDGGDSYACDWSDWAYPRLIDKGNETKLTDLKWKSAKTGWGKVNLHKN